MSKKSPVPINTVLADALGHVTQPWAMFFNGLGGGGAFLTDTHANRANYTAASTPGQLFYESDRQVWYYSDGSVWRYFMGMMSDTLANQPLDLANEDEGFLYQITTGTGLVAYYHTARWTGSAWTPAPGERWGGYFSYFAVAPQEFGWHPCDGTATKYLDVSLGALAELNFTTPNEVGAYRKGAAAYSGSVVPATAHAHGVGSLAVGFASGTQGVTVGGVGVASQLHTHGIGGATATDSTAEPAHVEMLPYFRR